MNIGIGDFIRIIKMDGEPNYKDKEGVVLFVDDFGFIHGTWGGCAICPQNDVFIVLKHGIIDETSEMI